MYTMATYLQYTLANLVEDAIVPINFLSKKT